MFTSLWALISRALADTVVLMSMELAEVNVRYSDNGDICKLVLNGPSQLKTFRT